MKKILSVLAVSAIILFAIKVLPVLLAHREQPAQLGQQEQQGLPVLQVLPHKWFTLHG
jgi:hypothetical protein